MQLRKTIVGLNAPTTEAWLPIAELAAVSVSSEDPEHPIERALVDTEGTGWRAAEPGAQCIRIHFDQPQSLRRIHLVFEESRLECVHEFALQWSHDSGRSFQPVVRQQFSFSPAGATRQREDYDVVLDGVTVLELHMIPDISRGPRLATLTTLRLR